MLPRFAIAALLSGLSLLPGESGAQGPVGFLTDFTKAERSAILQHGPWPLPSAPDPSNRVSRRPDAAAFGKRLFFDARLSANGKVSCATCHQPEKSWTDGRPLAAGLAEADRNTPTLLNVRAQRWFGWDGAHDNLWGQSIRPLLDAREMGSDQRNLARLVRGDAGLACRHEKAFGSRPSDNDEIVLVNVGKALAAFQETLVGGRTPFDDFRDALERGDLEAAARYPMDAQRGLRIFVGRGNCSQCHAGPNFTDGGFHAVGIPAAGKAGGEDRGRYEGIGKLRVSRYNLLGRFNDDPVRAPGTGTRGAVPLPQTAGQFKVPTLRNVALTAPYMHNGHLATLADVVRHYSKIDPARLRAAGVNVDSLLKPLKLTSIEISYVVAFLQTLTDDEGRAPRDHSPDGCP